MFTGQTKREKEQANEEVKQWSELADEWIKGEYPKVCVNLQTDVR